MKLEDYKEILDDDFKASADANGTSPSQEFINFAVNIFNDAEEVMDMNQCYFEMTNTNNRRKMMIDGYAYDEADRSYTFFIAKYDNSSTINTIIKTEIDSYIKYMEAFIQGALSGFIQANSDVSSEGNQIADTLDRRFKNQNVSKFKFYIITNCILSDRVINIKEFSIYDMKVDVQVWDLQKFFNCDNNYRQKEPIFIDVCKHNDGKGLPAIEAFNDEDADYIAYLAVIPGTLLAEIYDEYGSRLLEGNVRSFLSASGKVNKGIKETILKSPKYFFTYNNGIATTASEITTNLTKNGLEITSIKDLQIINGGQTTASLLNTKINYKNETHLEEIFVPMKLTVIKPGAEDSSKLIENISRCANSQNKVSDADFFSNNPFHIQFEKLCRENPAPYVNGNQYSTYWFYERARGSYKQEQMKLTRAERKKFELLHPRSQLISKTDLAKYLNSYYQLPQSVSKGSQKNMKEFAVIITKLEDLSKDNINVYFFKTAISLAIMFKTLEKEISKSYWFPQGSGYRANIVTYTIAKLFYCLSKQAPNSSLNFNLIWEKQRLYPELLKVLLDLAEKTYKFINRSDRVLMNISEWCKKDECWKKYQNEEYKLPEYFLLTLSSKIDEKNEKTNAYKDQKLTSQVNDEIFVVNLGSEYWNRLMQKAKSMRLCTLIDESDLNIAIKMDKTSKIPNPSQCKRLLKFRKKCSDEGIDVDNI